MNCSFTFDYDGKNDRYEIEYRGDSSIEVVYVGGRAMEELAKTRNIGVKEQHDIGTAIADFLSSEGIQSLRENPVFILPEPDMGVVNNALAVTNELKEVCRKYLEE